MIIGNEILSGRTQDRNISFISKWLNSKCGISVEEVRIIPDVEKKIIDNIITLSKKFKYVFNFVELDQLMMILQLSQFPKAFKKM